MATMRDPGRPDAGGGPVTFDTVRRLALALPEVEEGTWFGTPAFRVREKSFTRLREEGVLVVLVSLFERAYLMEDFPQAFYITDHYRDYPAMLVRLSAVTEAQLRERLEAAWRIRAPKRLVAAYDRGHPPA